MEKIKDGGSAFPRILQDETKWTKDHPGMTLRDYFAAHAPREVLWPFDIDISDMGEEPSMKAGFGWQAKQKVYMNEVTRRRYTQWPFVWADAMIKERSNGEN